MYRELLRVRNFRVHGKENRVLEGYIFRLVTFLAYKA